ncbi:MAG TPA: energy transducer TonB [Edaphobacter sp.]|nr:energy transducer TonB [Edaphobacter sp.]
MNFFSDTQEIAWRFGEYIDDLHDVFRCNDVDFGAPEDFFAFARTLRYHSELRGDVLRVVKSVMESGTNVSFRTILTVIAVASGGPEIATCEREMSVPVKQVIESLIGAGAWSQPNADHSGLYPDVTVKGTEPVSAVETWRPGGNATGEAMAGTEENAVALIVTAEESPNSGAEVAYAEVSGHAKVEKEMVAEDSSGDSSLASSIDEKLANSPSALNGEGGGSSEAQGEGQGLLNESGKSSMSAESTLAESLTRLELNSLQLKVYLDSIDQRISRMEPRLEKVAPLVLSTPQGRAKEEPAPRFSAAIASENAELASAGESLPQRDDLSVGNEPGIAAVAHSEATGPVAVRARAGADSREFKVEHIRSRRRQSLPIFVGVAIPLLAASLFWWLGRYSAPVMLPGNASVDGGAKAVGAGASTGITPASQGSAPLVRIPQGTSVGGTHGASADQASTPGGGAQGESVATGYAGQSGSQAAAEKAAALTKRSAQIPSRTQTPLRTPLQPSSPAAAPMMAKGSAEVADPSDDVSDGGEDVSSVPGSSRPVDVSSGVMAANLLSAPKPEYPKLATLTRTQGSVVMQAVISKDGAVEEVHVIKGHRLLRGAAKNAVRNWRYRPYKVGGVAVAVATTVSVDFSLHH